MALEQLFGAYSPSLGLLGISVAVLWMIVLLMIVFYVYTALVLMTIGKKLNIEPTWLAWIPIVNVFYIPMLAGYEWYYGFLWLLGMIPIVGGLVSIGLTIWWWWRISEARKQPGWYGILMIVPVVQWVFMGIVAWKD